MNLDDLFRNTARQLPAAPAVLGPGPDTVLTYQQLDSAIDSVAEQLDRAGVRPRLRVGVHLRTGTDYLIHIYALWRCGACAVPIATELAADEKRTICREMGLDFTLFDRRTAALSEVFCGDVPIDLTPVTSLLRLAPSTVPPEGLRSINAAFIRFSSGTTGEAKGVVLSHETIFERVHAANEVLHIGPEDRVAWLLSMAYHFTATIVGYLTFGAALILPPNHLAAGVLGAAHQHRATLIYAAPAHYVWLSECSGAGPLPSLRLAISTTAALQAQTANQFRQRFGVPVSQALGIIEVGLPFINLEFAAERPEAIGRALPAYATRFADVGLGAELREIHIAGPGLLDAYYRPWQTRAEIMPDGWFRTGDVGEQDADGCVHLRGRVKDLINVLGMKVFSQEVEAVLTEHSGVAEALVFAKPDPWLGEAPFAQVVVRLGCPVPTPEELIAHCRHRLAAYKVPTGIHIVSSLRRTASGKTLRRNLGS